MEFSWCILTSNTSTYCTTVLHPFEMAFIPIFRSDVWAFGILMFEILTIGENPYRYSNVKNRDYKERLKKEFE